MYVCVFTLICRLTHWNHNFLRSQHYDYFLDAYARSIDQLLYKYIRDGSRDRTRTHHVYREIYGKQLSVKYSRYADPMERTVISLSPLESFRENGYFYINTIQTDSSQYRNHLTFLQILLYKNSSFKSYGVICSPRAAPAS